MRRGGFETRSAGRGWFWPKGRRRPSRVRISRAPCSEGGCAGRVWWSRGQHSRLSTRAPTFNSRIPCGRAAIAALWGCQSSFLIDSMRLKNWLCVPNCVYLRSLAEVLDLRARRTRVRALAVSLLLSAIESPHSVNACFRTIRASFASQFCALLGLSFACQFSDSL